LRGTRKTDVIRCLRKRPAVAFAHKNGLWTSARQRAQDIHHTAARKGNKKAVSSRRQVSKKRAGVEYLTQLLRRDSIADSA
jgi:hypothetical protein